MKLNSFITTVIIAVVLGCMLTMSVHAKTLTVALDLSGSNALIADKNFAVNAARYTAAQIADMDYKDTVRLMYFGDRQNKKNLHEKDYTISKRQRAAQVAERVGRKVAALPLHENIGQRETNIVAFLELTSGFDCANGSHILIITDGLEATKYFDPQSFMKGDIPLPKPDVNLKGCSVTFYGIGVGLDGRAGKIIRKAWQSYIKAAGARVTVISR